MPPFSRLPDTALERRAVFRYSSSFKFVIGTLRGYGDRTMSGVGPFCPGRWNKEVRQVKKTVFLFPGQGSQSVGMGQELCEEFAFIREFFDMAEEVCKMNLRRVMFQGPMEELTRTVVLQPAVTALNLACRLAVEKEDVTCNVTAGHSLGEYAALACAGVLSDPDAMRAVQQRGALMDREALKHKGAMAAVLGLDIAAVSDLVSRASGAGVVAVANHNTAEQIVVTGEPDAVGRACALAKEAGGKAIPLKVSGAWHSPLIAGAAEEFAAFLADLDFNAPGTPVLLNVTADAESDPAALRDIMARQFCAPVKWYDSMGRIIEDPETDYVFAELGPGKVLAGMMKKIAPKDLSMKIFNVFDVKTLEAFLTEVK